MPVEQRAARRQVQQLTREQWAELDPEMQEVLRVTQPERVPGAEVRSRDAAPNSKALEPSPIYRPPTQVRVTPGSRPFQG